MKDEFKTVRFDLLKEEIDNLVSLITAEEYEVVFGHHDLQHCNILTNEEGKIMFVDFEYAFYDDDEWLDMLERSRSVWTWPITSAREPPTTTSPTPTSCERSCIRPWSNNPSSFVRT